MDSPQELEAEWLRDSHLEVIFIVLQAVSQRPYMYVVWAVCAKQDLQKEAVIVEHSYQS
jgi:hypothetical protein